MRISDWSSDVCSSDLPQDHITLEMAPLEIRHRSVRPISAKHAQASRFLQQSPATGEGSSLQDLGTMLVFAVVLLALVNKVPAMVGGVISGGSIRSEEHTSDLQSLMRTSYAVFCLKKT